MQDFGGAIAYKANVKKIITEGEGEQRKAVGVEMLDGSRVFAKTVISNATRWDTFGSLLQGESISENEHKFRQRYTKAPSFLSIHLGVRADLLPV